MSVGDYTIIVLYLAVSLGAGLLARGQQKNEADFFTGSGHLRGPLWSLMVGCSISASFFSGISFLSIPSLVFENGAMLAASIIVYPIGIWVVNYWFLPRFIPLGSEAPYDLVERRFGRGVRRLVSVAYLLMRLTWMGVLLYAPALLLLVISGWGPSGFWPVILTLGIISTLYTALGGLRSVVVTDALQFLVIMAGILGIVYFALSAPAIPFSQALGEVGARWGATWVDFSLNPKNPVSLSAIFSGMLLTHLAIAMADQMSLQRYLASGTLKDSRRAIVVSAIGGSVTLLLLTLVGLAVWVWSRHVPDAHIPKVADQVLPYFLAHTLPTGFKGFLVAAILAATMSSLTSGINIVSCSVLEDFRSSEGTAAAHPSQRLRLSRWVSVGVGILVTASAGFVEHLGSIFDVSKKIMGLFYAPVMACILTVFLFPKAPPILVGAGMIFGCLAGVAAASAGWASLLVGPLSFLVAIGLPALGSIFFPVTPREIHPSSTKIP